MTEAEGLIQSSKRQIKTCGPRERANRSVKVCGLVQRIAFQKGSRVIIEAFSQLARQDSTKPGLPCVALPSFGPGPHNGCQPFTTTYVRRS